jgi:hypothetical protein
MLEHQAELHILSDKGSGNLRSSHAEPLHLAINVKQLLRCQGLYETGKLCKFSMLKSCGARRLGSLMLSDAG